MNHSRFSKHGEVFFPGRKTMMDNYFVLQAGFISGWLGKSKMLVHLKIPRSLLCRLEGIAFKRMLTAVKYPTDMTEFGGPVYFVKFHGLSWKFLSKLPGSRSQEVMLKIKFCEGLPAH